VNPKIYAFTAVIHKVPDQDGAYVEFPYDVKSEFGKGRVKVSATFDCEPYDGSIVNMGVKNADGSVCYIIGVRKDIRAKTGKHPGDTISVTIRERARPRNSRWQGWEPQITQLSPPHNLVGQLQNLRRNLFASSFCYGGKNRIRRRHNSHANHAQDDAGNEVTVKNHNKAHAAAHYQRPGDSYRKRNDAAALRNAPVQTPVPLHRAFFARDVPSADAFYFFPLLGGIGIGKSAVVVIMIAIH
jgi:hypothetical protein